ncbi:unnamed protein product, partial [Musa textilis]
VDLVVGGSERVKENVVTTLLNLIKSDGDKAMGDIMEADEVEVAMSALPSGDSGVSARGKSKAKALLRVLESGWVS